jgi:acyl carrier protein
MSSSASSTEEIVKQLCSFLSDNVLASSVDLSPDTHLTSIGVDSFSLMEMILFIERRFGLVLPAESLTADNISSVNALSQHCAFLLNSADG